MLGQNKNLKKNRNYLVVLAKISLDLLMLCRDGHSWCWESRHGIREEFSVIKWYPVVLQLAQLRPLLSSYWQFILQIQRSDPVSIWLNRLLGDIWIWMHYILSRMYSSSCADRKHFQHEWLYCLSPILGSFLSSSREILAVNYEPNKSSLSRKFPQ